MIKIIVLDKDHLILMCY